MFGLGTTEIALIVFAILILFGAKKIPQLARGIGEGVRELRKALSGKEESNKEEITKVKSKEEENLPT